MNLNLHDSSYILKSINKHYSKYDLFFCDLYLFKFVIMNESCKFKFIVGPNVSF